MESFLEKIGTLRKQHEMLLSAANVPVDVPGYSKIGRASCRERV